MDTFSNLLGIVSLVFGIIAFLFPDSRHLILGWLSLRNETKQKSNTPVPNEAFYAPSQSQHFQQHLSAWHFINLGEHLSFLSMPHAQNDVKTRHSQNFFTASLKQCQLNTTLKGAQKLLDASSAEMPANMKTIRQLLMAEVTPTQKALITLGEMTWQLCQPKTMTYLQLHTCIRQFQMFLNTYQLRTASTAATLLQIDPTQDKYRFISDATARKIALAMRTIHAELAAETKQRKVIPQRKAA